MRAFGLLAFDSHDKGKSSNRKPLTGENLEALEAMVLPRLHELRCKDVLSLSKLLDPRVT